MPYGEYEIPLDLTRDAVDDLDGDGVIPAGKYHVLITGLKRETDGVGCLRYRYQVLAGTVPAAAGASGGERFYLSEDAKRRLKILAHRLGLINDGDFGRQVMPEWQRAVGRELVVEVKNENFTDKKGQARVSSKWDFAGFWVPEDPRCAGVPLDPERARQVRASLGGSAAAATSRPAAAQQTQAPAAPMRQTTMAGAAATAYDDV
jgi:hypothetical protein